MKKKKGDYLTNQIWSQEEKEKRVKVGGAHLASLHPYNAASFEEMLQQWWAVGNTVSDLTSPRFDLRFSAPETNTLLLEQLPEYYLKS